MFNQLLVTKTNVLSKLLKTNLKEKKHPKPK